MATHWTEHPPVHVSVASYMKAVANQGNSFQPVDPALIDWADMTTTAPKPTEDQIRSLAHHLSR